MTTIRRATSADVPQLIDVWSEAMANEPMARWPLTGSRTDDAIRRLFSVLAREYVAAESVWVDDDVRAGAAWLAPSAAELVGDVDAIVAREVAALTDDGGERYRRLWEWAPQHVAPGPAWFLDVLAVSPAAQGRGLGRMLMEHGLALAAADGLPAVLETGTAANVAYYERFGFEVTRELQAPDGGPTVWFMTHPRHPPLR